MAEQGGSVRWIIEADDSQFNQALQAAEESAQKFAKDLNDVDASDALKKNADEADNLAKSIGGLDNVAKSSSSTFANLAKSVGSVAWNTFTTGAGVAATALTTLFSKGIKSADFLETSRTAMSGLIGSVEEGNRAMSIAANYWQNNPFQRIDVTNATKQLVQFGRTTGQISKDLEILGDVSLSTGAPIDELARYYARVSASGRAMTMDLEMMSDRGIPIYRELQKATGKTTEEVRKMASEGKISFDIFKKAMEGAVDATAMEQYENTLARQVDRIKGSIQILGGELAGYQIVNDQLIIKENGLTKATTRLIKALATGLRGDKMKTSLAKLGEAITPLIDKLTDKIPGILDKLGNALDFISSHTSSLIPILGGALVVFGKLGAGLPGIGSVISNLGSSFQGLSDGILSFAKKKPLLAGFLAVFATGFVKAYKENESFRESVQKMVKSIGDMITNLTPVFNVLIDLFSRIISSGSVVGILQAVVNTIGFLADVLAHTPTEVLIAIITAFASFKLINTNPLALAVIALVTLIETLKALQKETQIFTKIGEAFKNFGQAVAKGVSGAVNKIKNFVQNFITIGHNFVVGLFNGIVDGTSKVKQAIVNVANSIVKTFKSALGIHSPSKVMAELGGYITLGLAQGITDKESVVQKAMDNLANDILSTAEKIIQNKADFGVIDIAGQYREWKKVSELFTVGSVQYQNAIERMEEARKSANLEILKLQQNYNEKLDDTIDKIGTMYGVFDEVDLSGGKNAEQIISNLDQQVAKMQEWATDQEIIAGLDLDPKFIEELQQLGVDATYELSAIAGMTGDQIAQINSLWLKKQEIATKAATKQLSGFKDETLDQISELKNGIDAETVDVQDVGGRLVANIGEGITGALPTLDSAWSQIDTYIENAARELGKTSSGVTQEVADDLAGLATDTTDTNAAIADSLTDITKNVEGFSAKYGGIILGVIGLIGGIKLIKGGANIFGSLKNLFGGGKEAAGKVAEAAKDAGNIAKSADGINTSVAQTGQGFSKANSVLDTVKKGAQTVIWIAGAIAAMAVAIRIAYEALKDVDWAGFASAMGQVAIAIGAFGLLAFGVDKLQVSGKSIAIIIGLAADLAVMALAVRVAYEALEPVDWASFGRILGEVSATIGALGILAGVIGAFAFEVAIGMAIILGLAVDLAAMALSLRISYEALEPVDWPSFGKILGEVSATIGALGVLAGVLGAFAPFEAAGVLIILGLAEDLRQIATALALTNAILPDDMTALNNKLDTLKGTIGVMGLLGGAIGIFAPLEMAGVAAIKSLASAVVSIAQALMVVNYSIPDDLTNVINKFNLVETVITRISKTNMGSLLGNLTKTWKIDQIIEIIKDYQTIAAYLQQIGETIQIDSETIIAKIHLLEQVVNVISQNASDKGFFGQLNDVVSTALNTGVTDNAAKILGIYSTLGESLSKIQNIQADFDQVKYKVSELGKIVQLVTEMKGDGGIFGAIGNFFTGNPINEEQIGKVVSILNKMSEIASTINAMQGVYVDGARTKISEVGSVITEVGNIKDPGNLSNKEWVVGMATSISYKLREFIAAFSTIGAVNGDLKTFAANAIDAVWNVCSVNTDVGDLSTKEWIIGMATSMAYKLAEFNAALTTVGDSGDKTGIVDQLLNTMGTLISGVKTELNDKLAEIEQAGTDMALRFRDGMLNQENEVRTAGQKIQGFLWSAIESKMNDEYQQGQYMARKFAEGLQSISGEIQNAGANAQGSFWWGVQNRMNDEYWQGRSMGENFRQGLYDVDYGNAGWWAVQGFINGAYSQNVWSVGWNIANNFLNGLKYRGQQGSPWKTTYQSGAWAGEGLKKGIESSESAVVGAAYNLADQVVDALDMNDITMTPTLEGRVTGMPVMTYDENEDYASGSNKRNVIIEQTNNNYTNYSLQAVNRDLAWELSKI